MRRIILINLVVLLLVACKPGGQQSAEQVAAPAVAPSAMEQPPVAPTLNPEFPVGFEPSFAYKIRSRAVEDVADGQVRKLVIEFKEGDMGSVDSKIEEALVAKGYRRYKTLDQDGSIVGDYGKEGHRVTVTTTPANGKLALDADSLGTSYFVWKE